MQTNLVSGSVEGMKNRRLVKTLAKPKHLNAWIGIAINPRAI